MITGIRPSLDILKNQALFSILGNINIKHEYIKQDIYNKINNPDGTFISLLNILKFDPAIISSSQMNAVILMSYLDFYSMYVIATTNYQVMLSLNETSKNKFLYIESMYKDMLLMIKEKEIDKKYKNTLFINFTNTKGIDINRSSLGSRDIQNSNILSFYDSLTLPIIKSKSIKPYSIISHDKDNSLHYIDNYSTSEIIYNIKRKQNAKIGIVKRINIFKDTISYNIDPTIDGTMVDFISDKVYIEITNIKDDYIYIKTSLDGNVWWNEYEIKYNDLYDILIFGEVTGLKIKFIKDENLSIGDSWEIELKPININSPRIISNIKFDILQNVSYIKYSDLSPYSINLINHKFYKRKKEDITINYLYKNDIFSIIPINNSISDYVCELEQNECYNYFNEYEFVYNYPFIITNIEAVINEYSEHGNITLNKLYVENIGNIRIKKEEYIPVINNSKSFIEDSIIIESGNSMTSIPMTQSSIINDYIIPFEIDTSNKARYKTRFPVKNINNIKIINIQTNEQYIAPIQLLEELSNGYCIINIEDYVVQNGYYLEYELKTESVEDAFNISLQNTKWNISGNTYYMYYIDIDNNISLSIREYKNEALELFNGSISGNIEMRSFDSQVTPMIFEYSILCD